MDQHDRDTLVTTGPPRPEGAPRLVDREWIEDSMSLWEEALSRDLPASPAESRSPVFVAPDEPMTAPVAESRSVEPESVQSSDGFEPRPEEAFREALQEAAAGRLQAQVSVRLPDRRGGRPAKRVYTFAGAVSDGESPSGTLYALGRSGLVRLDGDVKATRVVEVLESPRSSPHEETLSCEVEGGVARWSQN